MNTQVIFKIDKELKNSAMKKAEQHGITLSSFLKLATTAFIEDKIKVGILSSENLNQGTVAELKEIQKDIQKGKNISRGFSNSKTAADYLRK